VQRSRRAQIRRRSRKLVRNAGYDAFQTRKKFEGNLAALQKSATGYLFTINN
jgi:hypothetical protein